jgi:hypothetical protein
MLIYEITAIRVHFNALPANVKYIVQVYAYAGQKSRS